MPNQKKSSAKSPQKFSPKLNDNLKALILIVAIAAVLFYFKNLFVAATVNGRAISRLALVSELEKRSGRATLESMVTKELLLQEAKKRGVAISQQEIDQELNRIEATVKQQGGNLEQVLTAQGMTRKDLREQVLVQKILEKMLADELKVSDQEAEQFMTQNQESLPETTDSAALKASVRQQLAQNKLSQKAQELLDNLKKSSKINYFVTY